MFSRQLLLVRSHICKSNILSSLSTIYCSKSCRSYRGVSSLFISSHNDGHMCIVHTCSSNYRKYSAAKHLNSETQEELTENELKNVYKVFPTPKVTLNSFNQKTPEGAFDISFKQRNVTPKGARVAIDFTCTYSFVWPEKIKFIGTGASKQKAAEKAALQALQWLIANNRIDRKGCPIYNEDVINEVKSNLNEDLTIEVNEASVNNINNIWEDYQEKIKNIYDATFEEAEKRVIQSEGLFKKDSSLEEDENIIDGPADAMPDDALT